jgi:tRNA-splicing ligase RtcB
MSDLKIFTENIEPEALNQIYTLVKQPAFADCKVRIMPDVHAGAGCVIGFTADLGDKVIPNIVGVDIGCGMLTVELGNIEIDLAQIDTIIRKYVPSGRNVHEGRNVRFEELQQLRCFRELKDTKRLERSIGTLGGGNHFIEIDTDSEGVKYLIIHSGSRNLGKQVAEYYQKLAVEIMSGKDELYAMQEKLIAEYKAQGRKAEIQKAIAELHRKFHPNPLGIPKELCYLTGKYREDYLHDMKICQHFAAINRYEIANAIVGNLFGADIAYWNLPMFETIHNYIEFGSNMVRKGAISAKAGEKLLIPINMRDGCIIGVGKGNEDWNCSAPHGAGRIMSRSKAKELVSLEEFEDSMKGIFTTSVGQSTIDEAPMVYKPMDEIIQNIADTVDILKIVKPIYNFKASE